MKNINNKEKILRILKVLDIKDDIEIKKEIYNIMYPRPFFHKIKKNKELGKWNHKYYDYFEDWTWEKEDIDKQFYHCEKMSCSIDWKEKEIERYKEQGKDLTKIPGCDGPSKISNLNYLSDCLNEYFKDKYKEKYIYSIGLIWAYKRNNFIIGEKNNIIELFDKWIGRIENTDYDIYEWWIFNSNNIRNIIANLIIANMLGKEFDSDGELKYKLKGEKKENNE